MYTDKLDNQGTTEVQSVEKKKEIVTLATSNTLKHRTKCLINRFPKTLA